MLGKINCDLANKGGIPLSEENKNRGRDKGKQKNIQNKYNTEPKNTDTEFAEESEFLNINGKRNKRMR